MRGCGRFFDQGGVLLGQLIKLGHIVADLADAGSLLAGRGSNLPMMSPTRCTEPTISSMVWPASCTNRAPDSALCSTEGADQRLDLLGGGCAALGQRAHFTRDDGKATALLTRAGGFDRCVQGQNIRLERNPDQSHR